MQVIFGNYGDNTIALIQWAHEHKLSEITVVHIETGWAALSWQKQVEQGQLLAKKYGFNVISLRPQIPFDDLVRDRKSFPNAKFGWCTTFLKTLPLLAWLDEVDDRCEATIVLGSRRADSRARMQLVERINESEHYGDRQLFFPLCHYSDEMRNDLIKRAGFLPLNHRSLECDPCIHSRTSDFIRLEENSIFRIANLEREIETTMFYKPIDALVVEANQKNNNDKNNLLEVFDMGCGSRYVCGE